jgi:TPR repeat protein
MIAAANSGKKEAVLSLAQWYETGRLVEQNLVQAVLWYEKAAQQGSEVAQQALKRFGATLQVEKKPSFWRKLFGGTSKS